MHFKDFMDRLDQSHQVETRLHSFRKSFEDLAISVTSSANRTAFTVCDDQLKVYPIDIAANSISRMSVLITVLKTITDHLDKQKFDMGSTV